MLQLAAYVHDLDPFVFRFPDWMSFIPAPGVRWYGTSYLVGFLFAGLLVRRVAKVGKTTLPVSNVADMVVALAIGAVVGGRLGYVLFYDTSLLTRTLDSFPYWGVFAFNQGGMASHGGIIGVVIGCMWVARRGTLNHAWLEAQFRANEAAQGKAAKGKTVDEKAIEAEVGPRRIKHRFLHILDLAALGTPLGLGLGRVANFINGELYGRPCEPDYRWATQFPQEMRGWSLDKLAELKDAVTHLGVTAADWLQAIATLQGDGGGNGGGDVTALDISKAEQFVFSTRARLIESTHGDGPVSEGVIEALRPLLTPRYPSQLFQAALEGFLLFAILVVVWAKPRKTGVLAGVFALGYGLFRIIGEQYRLPDAHLGYQWLGLTRGQWLSVGMPLLGLVMIAYFQTRKSEPMGGLLPVKSGTPKVSDEKRGSGESSDA